MTIPFIENPRCDKCGSYDTRFHYDKVTDHIKVICNRCNREYGMKCIDLEEEARRKTEAGRVRMS